MPDINQQIEQRIQAFVADLSALVRKAAIEAVGEALGARGEQRPTARRAAAAVVVAGGAPIRKGPKGKRGRRTEQEIEATLNKVLAYVQAHPAVRSEKIRTGLNMPREVLRDALSRLMDSKKLRMKGARRGASYTVA